MVKPLFAALTRNFISLLGVMLAGGAAVLIVLLAALGATGLKAGSFLGIVAYLLLPGVLVLGLLLIPVGLWWQHRTRARGGAQGGVTPSLPVIDLNRPTTRGALVVALLLGLSLVVILAGAGYKGVEILESTEFCGQACHVTMQPEAVAHERSPHANVACVQCHVGPARAGSSSRRSTACGRWPRSPSTSIRGRSRRRSTRCARRARSARNATGRPSSSATSS